MLRLRGLLLVGSLLAASPCTAQGTGLIAFDHYHTLDEIGSYLEAFAAQYPQLVTLEVLGSSRERRAIWAVGVHHRSTGAASAKPRLAVQGTLPCGQVMCPWRPEGGEGSRGPRSASVHWKRDSFPPRRDLEMTKQYALD